MFKKNRFVSPESTGAGCTGGYAYGRHPAKTNKPFVIDVSVDRQAMAPSVGTRVLPPFPQPELFYGKRNLRT